MIKSRPIVQYFSMVVNTTSGWIYPPGEGVIPCRQGALAIALAPFAIAAGLRISIDA